jgi:outer membrane cobalamin receptor
VHILRGAGAGRVGSDYVGGVVVVTAADEPSDAPTLEEVRTFLHKQIAEVRAMGLREGENVTERVNDMLEKLHDIETTHAFAEMVTTARRVFRSPAGGRCDDSTVRWLRWRPR